MERAAHEILRLFIIGLTLDERRRDDMREVARVSDRTVMRIGCHLRHMPAAESARHLLDERDMRGAVSRLRDDDVVRTEESPAPSCPHIGCPLMKSIPSGSFA